MEEYENLNSIHLNIKTMTKFLFIALLFVSLGANAQTNTFPASGNVGLGTTTPTQKLDIRGNIYLRNMANLVGAGTSISFSSYDDTHLGPKIYSYLDYANGTSSISRLILSSYSGGYYNELTLIGGRVGIGTMNPADKLSVNGKIRCHEIKAETANWPDYVFAETYKLPSLKETENYIKENGHLADIPSAADIEKNGQNLGEMNALLLKKIEELTLHLIEKDNQLSEQKARTDAQFLKMSAKVNLIEKALKKIQNCKKDQY